MLDYPAIQAHDPGPTMIKKSFQDILCELIAARISRSSEYAGGLMTADDLLTHEKIYNEYVKLAQKIYNQQEPK